MKAYTNVTGQTHAQPDGQDWPPGVTLTRWGAADVAALVAYGYVAETQPGPARAARLTPAPAPQAAPAAPEPAPAPTPAPAPSRRRRKEST